MNPTGGTLILQSRPVSWQSPWHQKCVDSVQSWADGHNYQYRCLGDELFKDVPDWYLHKTEGRMPIAADLGRLQWLWHCVSDGGFQRAAWFDADVLVMNPGRLSIDAVPADAVPADGVSTGNTCAFGREVWVSEDHGRWRVHRSIHNAVCVFRSECPVLPFLIHTVSRIIERANPGFIAPQMVGPKLLSALHNLVGFALLDSVGAVSPALAEDLLKGSGAALARFDEVCVEPPAALNLCASLNGRSQVDTSACDGNAVGSREMDQLIERLLARYG